MSIAIEPAIEAVEKVGDGLATKNDRTLRIYAELLILLILCGVIYFLINQESKMSTIIAENTQVLQQATAASKANTEVLQKVCWMLERQWNRPQQANQ